MRSEVRCSAVTKFPNLEILLASRALTHTVAIVSILALAIIASNDRAHGAACSQAKNSVERQICSTPDVRALDTKMGELFLRVRRATSPVAVQTLVGQQRRWLAQREAKCPTADISCLRAEYLGRLDQLRALDARLIDGRRLDDVTPIILRGTWRVGEVLDPEGGIVPNTTEACCSPICRLLGLY